MLVCYQSHGLANMKTIVNLFTIIILCMTVCLWITGRTERSPLQQRKGAGEPVQQ